MRTIVSKERYGRIALCRSLNIGIEGLNLCERINKKIVTALG